MSGDGGSRDLVDDLDVVDQQRHPWRRSDGGEGKLEIPDVPTGGRGLKSKKSLPIPIPYASLAPANERQDWNCLHEVAQQSLNEMDMRISRSRDLRSRSSLRNGSQSNQTESPFTSSSGLTVSLATPDDDLRQQWQREDFVYPGSPPSEHRHRSYSQSYAHTVGSFRSRSHSSYHPSVRQHLRLSGELQQQQEQQRSVDNDDGDVSGGRSGHYAVPTYRTRRLEQRYDQERSLDEYPSAAVGEGGDGGDDGSDRPDLEDDDGVAEMMFSMELF